MKKYKVKWREILTFEKIVDAIDTDDAKDQIYDFFDKNKSYEELCIDSDIEDLPVVRELKNE